MKIIHIIWAFPVGGTETMLVELINRQCKKAKIFLIIINNQYNNQLISHIDQNVQIIKIERPSGSKNPWYLIKLWLLLAFTRASAIHCHNETICKVIPGFKTNTFLTVHALSFCPEYFKSFKTVFAISDSIREFIYTHSGIKAKLIYNGIDIHSIRKRRNYDFEKFKILQISRLVHEIKGQDVLIRALGYIVNELNIKNIQLDLIGSGPSYEYLNNLVVTNMITDYVNFKGEIEKQSVYNDLCNYNLLVQPSLNEGFGLTIAEAMVARVPVLVSNIDGPIELIKNGKYGSYFSSGNSIDCALKIVEIFSNYTFYTSNERMNMVSSYALLNFDINITADKYLAEYKK